jgi:uncharacterized protein (TIGR00288 family)
MKNLEEHKKIAVLIDADNAQYSRIRHVIDELSAHGHILVKRAYGDWSSDYLKNWKTVLNELSIQPVQQFAYTTGKNATDASMIIDAMDLLYSDRFDAFALVSSDSDFTKLAARLRESEIFVFGVGEKKTPVAFRNACDDFILTENLGVEAAEVSPALATLSSAEKKELVTLFTRAWDQYKDEDGWANIAPAGAFVKRLKPDFDPRSYGGKKLTDILEKLGKSFELRKEGNQRQFRPRA